MSAVGPDLPPHLIAKRKRQYEERTNDETPTMSGAKPVATSETAGKRKRVIGPAMPPTLPEQQPSDPKVADTTDSEDEDDLGPALPTDGQEMDDGQAHDDKPDDHSQAPAEPEKLRRDDWMTMAPVQDDLAARMDPTKMRARGFNTGRSARAGGGSEPMMASTWNETAAQKQKRLADEVLGIAPSGPQTTLHPPVKARTERNDETAQKLRENMEKIRGPSLLEKHRQDKPEKVDDDPSKRAFDREKDMSHASRISGMQKRDMIDKAAGYSSRFSGGSYL